MSKRFPAFSSVDLHSARPPLIRNKATRLRLLVLGEERFQHFIGSDAEVTALQMGAELEPQIKGGFDFVLVAPQLGSHSFWIGETVSALSTLQRLRQLCSACGIPIVVWHLEHATNVPLHLRLAAVADLICCAGPDIYKEYRRRGIEDSRLLLLPWGVATTEVHPFSVFGSKYPPPRAGTVFDGWYDLLQRPELRGDLKPLVGRRFLVVDSIYRLNDRQVEPTAEFAKSIKGCVSDGQLYDLYRGSVAALFTNKTARSPYTIDRLASSAAGCGCLPVFVGEPPPDIELPEGCLLCRNERELREFADAVERDRWQRTELQRLAHRAWRSVFRDRTCANRLDSISRALGIESGWKSWPLVTVVVPTNRPHLLDDSIAQYRKQTYLSKELVVVLHTNDDISAIKKRVESANSDVRILRQSTEVGVGGCLNLAFDVARGEYSIKMDDDDHYGENYLLDMVLPLRAFDADLFGKPPQFIYLESKDKTYLRTVEAATPHLITDAAMLASDKVRISGATHSGKTDALRRIRFPTTNVGSADTAFYRRCAEHKLSVGVWDGFNTLVVRHVDKNLHTWKIDDDVIRKNSREIADGLSVESATA